LRVAFRVYPRRAILGATLMITQSFLYNAVFFTYALVLTRFYHVSNNNVPLYGLAFAVGNLAGPLLLGHLFDTLARKKMISGTYRISGALLAFSAWLFASGRCPPRARSSSESSSSSSRPPGRAPAT
jgi:MFS family permease